MTPLHFALIGGDTSYSRSPDIFQATFRRLGIEGRFELCSVGPGQLESCVRRLIADGVTGISVTLPHKEAMLKYLDSADELVEATGAVNSLKVVGNALHGYNTDCFGAGFALKRAGFQACDGALILGAGGAARAVVVSLYRDFGVRRFLVCDRTERRLRDMKYFFHQRHDYIDIQTVTPSTYSSENMPASSLLVNCTPLGGSRFPDVSPIPTGLDWDKVAFYFDLNYNADNKAVSFAVRSGAKAIDGTTMLVSQAVKSMELWTGLSVEFESIYPDVFSGRLV